MRKNSGMKRGLATVAVSALAVTGLPFLMSSASANTLNSQAGGADQVVLVTPSQNASIRNDGVNTTVHLLAVGGADVAAVRFEYQATGDASPTVIATVNSRTNGAFSTEWTVPAAIYNLNNTTISAVALNSVSTVTDTASVVGQVSTTRPSIDIANAPGSSVGVFQQPYAAPNDLDLGAVSGTTSNLDVTPNIQLTGPLSGGANLQEDVAETVQSGDTVRDWSGSVDFSGYDWTGTPDEAVVRALTGPTGSDDGEAVTVYQQQIDDMTVVADPTSVQGANTATGIVTVLDDAGAPIAGVEVFQDDNNDNAGDGAAVYTNSRGEAKFPGLAGSPAGTQHSFYVNTTDTDGYENGTDFKTSVTVTSYAPVATSLTAFSKDGAAFDDDENAAGDIEVTVKDQNTNPLAGETVRYSWNVAPFATTAGYPKDLPEQTAVTGPDGTADIVFPTGEPSGAYTLNYYINTDGTPGQGATDPTGTDLAVKAGQAALTWGDGATAQAPAFVTSTFEGSLELEDGTGLTGRSVALSWGKDALGNAVLAAQPAQPAGTTRVNDTSATAVTEADGVFGIAISDPAAPDQDELNGDLGADTAFTAAAPFLDVDFLKNAGPSSPADIDIDVANLIDGLATPGRPVNLDIDVENSDDVDLTDYPVTIEVDHGFLSPDAAAAADLIPDPVAAQDGLYGEWKSDGTEKAYTTDDGGDTGAVVAIEDDAAFATSSTVITTVTVTAGTVSKTVPITFTSTAPLNGGEVRLALAAAADQTASVLPKAPTTETVQYDVFAEDQFGNLVGGESVDISDNLPGALMEGAGVASDGATTVNSQLENAAPALTLSSTVAGSQTVSGDWLVDSNTWTDGNVAPGFQPARDDDNEDTTLEDDAASVDWYAINYATSHYAMAHTGGATLPVGSTSTVTYGAVDQNGEPIQGLQVNFFRAGPDDEQDGAGDAAVETDENGLAQYVFQGIKKGTAIIEAVVRQPAPSTTIIPDAGVRHTVKFGTKKGKIVARLSGKSVGNKDVLTVSAPKVTKGAKVVLYRQLGNGQVRKVGQGRLNSQGKLTLRVKDANGRGLAKYSAIVRSTSRTLQDQTNTRWLR